MCRARVVAMVSSTTDAVSGGCPAAARSRLKSATTTGGAVGPDGRLAAAGAPLGWRARREISSFQRPGSDIAAGTWAAGAAPTPACGFPRHRPIAARPATAPSSSTDEARRAANSGQWITVYAYAGRQIVYLI